MRLSNVALTLQFIADLLQGWLMIWENSDSIKAQFNLLASVRFKDTLERILAFSHYPDRNVRLHGQSGLIFDRGPELRYHIKQFVVLVQQLRD